MAPTNWLIMTYFLGIMGGSLFNRLGRVAAGVSSARGFRPCFICSPLSTLRLCLHGQMRMTRGQCGSLLLHCTRLSLTTPCRSPGPLTVIRRRNSRHLGQHLRGIGKRHCHEVKIKMLLHRNSWSHGGRRVRQRRWHHGSASPSASRGCGTRSRSRGVRTGR